MTYVERRQRDSLIHGRESQLVLMIRLMYHCRLKSLSAVCRCVLSVLDSLSERYTQSRAGKDHRRTRKARHVIAVLAFHRSV